MTVGLRDMRWLGLARLATVVLIAACSSGVAPGLEGRIAQSEGPVPDPDTPDPDAIGTNVYSRDARRYHPIAERHLTRQQNCVTYDVGGQERTLCRDADTDAS